MIDLIFDANASYSEDRLYDITCVAKSLVDSTVIGFSTHSRGASTLLSALAERGPKKAEGGPGLQDLLPLN
jgi:hypothetical protein